MKNKYKLGTMVNVRHDGQPSVNGIIYAVTETKNGYFYSLTENSFDSDDTYAEEEVISAFRPITTRTPKVKKQKLSSNAKARARMNEESAQN